MRPIDLLDKSTHINSPAPQLDRSLASALTDIVGLNPHGEPNARFTWGQEAKRFQWGKSRLIYIDQRIPAIRHTRHTLKRVSFVETKTISVPVGIQDGIITFADKPQDILHYERKVLTEAPRVIAPGWLYELELVNLEWIGEQLWCFEQWYPAEHFGTEAQWNRVRYMRWPFEWQPERDVNIMLVGDADSVDETEDGERKVMRKRGGVVDALGPYPANGDYRSRYFLGEPYEYMRPILVGPKGRQVREFVKDTHLSYRAPGRDTLEAIRAAWQAREAGPTSMSPEQIGKQRFAEYDEAEDKATAASAQENYEALEDRRKKIQVGYGS